VKIVADDKIPFLRGALEPWAEVIYLPGKEITHAAVKDADAMLIRTRTKCNEQLLRDSKVRFIGTATIGYDHIDTDYCENNGIFWTNAPGCNSSSVRQYIASALLNLAHDNDFDLRDKTLGIVGVGNVGSKVEMFARSLGMKVLLNDPPRAELEGRDGFEPLGTLLKEADIITVHVPLHKTGENRTFHLFDTNVFSGMKRGMWFINSSRGEVVDTVSLELALKEHKIAGAVIDVWENEPDISLNLLSKVAVGTPHIAGYSTDGKANGTSMVVRSLAEFSGLPLADWYPCNVPEPEASSIEIDCAGKSFNDIIRTAVLHTYDVKSDDRNLRALPSGFENQRGLYPVRREFTSFSLKLRNCSGLTGTVLKNIGFTIL
jgi:erythronate-4-phosphate dehydrogenase